MNEEKERKAMQAGSELSGGLGCKGMGSSFLGFLMHFIRT